MTFEEILIYGVTFLVCALIVFFYLRKGKKQSEATAKKVAIAKEEGKFEPVSLYPFIDLSTCIGSGACITACPEKDILGIVDGKATVINTSSCIGHGACFHACPVEAISLRIGTEKRGVDLPHINPSYETNIKGIYIAGELGGMGLIKNSVEQGKQAIANMAKDMKPSKDGIIDLVIIGAGPAGISGSLEAKKRGINFLTLDQDSLGGTVYTFPREKVVMTHPMDLPLHGKLKLFETSKDQLIEVWRDVLEKNQITIQENTKVENISPIKDGVFRISTAAGEEILCNQILIAIGRRGSPRKLGVPGEENQNVAYRLLEPERISGKKIIVVGGGDSAVESAMLLMDNNQVTLSYRKEKFARIKTKNKQSLDAAIASEKLNVLLNSNLDEIKLDSVRLKVEGEDESRFMENDLVYIFAGGELPIKFLQNAGITVDKTFGKIVKKY